MRILLSMCLCMRQIHSRKPAVFKIDGTKVTEEDKVAPEVPEEWECPARKLRGDVLPELLRIIDTLCGANSQTRA